MKRSLVSKLFTACAAIGMAAAVTACTAKPQENEPGQDVEATEDAGAEATEAATEPVVTQATEAAEATENPAVDIVINLPEYSYNGDDPVEAAIADYIVDEIGQHYDNAGVGIPYFMIVAREEDNHDDICVYGEFIYESFSLDGDTLFCENGGSYPGVMHVKKEADDSYKVTSFDEVEDGSNFMDSVNKLFGDHAEEFMKVYSDDVAGEKVRAATIADYVKSNDMPVTRYQDFGWDPVELD